MAFKTHKNEISDFATPQEMFQDNKLKTIKGILDYQSQILNYYMNTINDSNIVNKNIAFELPTGSGKTLVGILIAEFHRRKYGRKSLFLCPTNQLVSQVCSQCRNQYGIEAIAFIGKQSEYSTASKSKYNLGQAIGVTTYSSFFAINSFFNDPDILIFDDVHSSENYIIDNWSLNITREEYPTLFFQVSILLKDVIGESGFYRIQADNQFTSDIMNWNDLLPRTKISPKINELEEILRIGTQETSLRFAWSRVADNLSDCQIYISWNSILIRPYIPPTETHAAFSRSLQRIFMSATLGSSGELERLTGCQKIKRLPIVSDWDTKGLGRRLFIFPDLSLDTDTYGTILTRLHKESKHSVIILPSDKDAKDISSFLLKSIHNVEVFYANDLIESKEMYCKSNNAIVIMANRFDGVDFPDDESRMLFIYNLPKVTHLQEKFFVGKMAASLLYAERIKTRIVQAVGRCTRNASDYSVVCILGDSILNDFTSTKIQSTYHPELRAEISFGVYNSKGCIRWLSDLVKIYSDDRGTEAEDDFFFDVVASLEENLLKLQNNNRFEQKAKNILERLLSMDGTTFEQAHLDLGTLLGYDAHKCKDSAAPDPYFIINDNLCIVAEDKIYEDDTKDISVSDVTQAGRHSTWIRENVKTLSKNARIITVLISNSSTIEESARTYAKDIFYVNRSDLHAWAITAINALRTARSRFKENGDADWRAYTKDLFSTSQVTPKAFVDFMTQRVLSSI